MHGPRHNNFRLRPLRGRLNFWRTPDSNGRLGQIILTRRCRIPHKGGTSTRPVEVQPEGYEVGMEYQKVPLGTRWASCGSDPFHSFFYNVIGLRLKRYLK